MKLAEALSERAELQKSVENLKHRLLRNAAVLADDAPAEAPDLLLDELESLLNRLAVLIQRINRTNVVARLGDGRSLMEALAERDLLRQRAKLMQQLADAATERALPYANAYGHVGTPTVDVSTMQKRANDYARDARVLDCQIQEANWTTLLSD